MRGKIAVSGISNSNNPLNENIFDAETHWNGVGTQQDDRQCQKVFQLSAGEKRSHQRIGMPCFMDFINILIRILKICQNARCLCPPPQPPHPPQPPPPPLMQPMPLPQRPGCTHECQIRIINRFENPRKNQKYDKQTTKCYYFNLFCCCCFSLFFSRNRSPIHRKDWEKA